MKTIFQILLIAIAVVFSITYIVPEYKEISKLKQQVSEYDNALDNAKSLEQKRDEILASYNSISKTNKERLEKILPDIDEDVATSGAVALILEVDKIASDNGLKITDINFSEPEKTTIPNGEDYTTSVLGFKTEASYNTFLAFLKDIESNLRLADVKRVAFSAPTPTRDKPVVNTGVLEYSFELQTYWLKN